MICEEIGGWDGSSSRTSFQSPSFDNYGISCLSFGLLSRDGGLDVAFLRSDKHHLLVRVLGRRQHNILCVPIKYDNVIDIPAVHIIAIGLLASDETVGDDTHNEYHAEQNSDSAA